MTLLSFEKQMFLFNIKLINLFLKNKLYIYTYLE